MINKYIVMQDGHIKSKKTNKNLTEYKMKNGHIFVELHIEKKKIIKKLAELILTEFKGPSPDNCQIIFKDGNYHNTNLSNLEWGSVELKRCTKCKKYQNNKNFSKKNIYCRVCTSIIHGHKQLFEKNIILSEIQKAYLAGFIDGEGCIYLKKGKHRKHSGVCYTAGVTIGNTNIEELTNIHKEVNLGYINIRKNKNPNHKPAAIWTITANGCRPLLKQLLPYLKLKKQQCILLMNYLDLAKSANIRENKNDYLSKVENLYLEIKKLNKKGV